MGRVWQESRRENDLGEVREDSRGRDKLKQSIMTGASENAIMKLITLNPNFKN